MSHRWDCPDRYESEREARRQASWDHEYGSYARPHDRSSQFTDCDEAQHDYERAYERERERLEEIAAEERRQDEAREQRRYEDRMEEQRYYDQQMQDAYDAMLEEDFAIRDAPQAAPDHPKEEGREDE